MKTGRNELETAYESAARSVVELYLDKVNCMKSHSPREVMLREVILCLKVIPGDVQVDHHVRFLDLDW